MGNYADYNIYDDDDDAYYYCAICGKSTYDLTPVDYDFGVYLCKECLKLKTDLRCPHCGEFVFREIGAGLLKKYPYVCVHCNENFYDFEVK